MQLIDRRSVLGLLLSLAATPLLGRPARAAAATLPPATLQLLETSPYVYVSPLKKNGQESSCHGEVWFAWIDGAVVLITAKDRWKATSVASGLDRAKIWVGDFGKWKQLIGTNGAFTKAPSFEARARLVKDPAILDRLLAAYERKYPAEITTWRDRFKSGFASGERVLIAYEPISS
jgi:hypothetical protein